MECSRWTDTGLHVGVLQLSSTIPGTLVNRIGADRNCHHYCGTISELLVFNRTLSQQEIITLEVYLKGKFGIA